MTHSTARLDASHPYRLDDCWNRIGVRGDKSCAELEQHIHCRNCPVYGAAAASLLDREPPSGYREQCTDQFSRAESALETRDLALFIFRVGAEWLALKPATVEEIAELRPIHSLPHRRRHLVLGLANVRGELLPCVSLAGLLAVQTSNDNPAAARRRVYPRLLVIQGESGRLVFPVDEVHGTEHFRGAEQTPAPSTVAKAKATYTMGVVRWSGRTVARLDDQLLHYALSRSLA